MTRQEFMRWFYLPRELLFLIQSVQLKISAISSKAAVARWQDETHTSSNQSTAAFLQRTTQIMFHCFTNRAKDAPAPFHLDRRPARHRISQACIALLALTVLTPAAQAQGSAGGPALKEVVISASRAEQRRFDAPGAIDSVEVDPFRTASALVNLSELMGAVPGLQIRDRQNFAQDL